MKLLESVSVGRALDMKTSSLEIIGRQSCRKLTNTFQFTVMGSTRIYLRFKEADMQEIIENLSISPILFRYVPTYTYICSEIEID